MKETSLDFVCGVSLFGKTEFRFQSEDGRVFQTINSESAKKEYIPFRMTNSIDLHKIKSLRDFLNQHIRKCEDEVK